MTRFKPKSKNNLMKDGWFKRPRGTSLKMASEIPSKYRCPSCGLHIQLKTATVVRTQRPANFSLELKATCDDCEKEMVNYVKDIE